MNTEKIELAVLALSHSTTQPGSYVLVLADFEQVHRIPILIGEPEAQAIALTMEKMTPLRPLTHDLFKSVVTALGGTLLEVLIYQLHDGIFRAYLVLQSAGGDIQQLDARTSDAVALAVRFDVPIFIYAHLMAEAGIFDVPLLGRPNKGSLAEYSLDELEELLQKVVEKEDYESAIRLRAYLKKRRGEA